MEHSYEIVNGRCIIPAGTTEICNMEFRDCPNLTSVILPEGLISIGRGAFEGCLNLRSVHIPASVRSISCGAFSSCCELESIEVAEDNPVYRSESNCCLTKDGRTLVFGCRSSVIPLRISVTGLARQRNTTGETNFRSRYQVK